MNWTKTATHKDHPIARIFSNTNSDLLEKDNYFMINLIAQIQSVGLSIGILPVFRDLESSMDDSTSLSA
jgi:hypothetical protein